MSKYNPLTHTIVNRMEEVTRARKVVDASYDAYIITADEMWDLVDAIESTSERIFQDMRNR